MATKTTKREYFAMLREIVVGMVENETVPAVENPAELIEFIDKSILELDKKTEKAKERAEKKKETDDELLLKVEAALTDTFRPAEQIMEDLEDIEGLTKQKVIARLTKLVNADRAQKKTIKEDKRKIMGYASINATEEE